MSTVQARRVVLVCVMGLLIVATYKGKSGKVPTSTRLWGTGWLAIMLGIAADFAPSVAGPFALLILAGSLTSGGDQAFTNLLGRAGAGGSVNQKSNPSGPPGPAGPTGPDAPPVNQNTNPSGPPGPGGPTN